MKQFSKWWHKWASTDDEYIHIIDAERAWRAALRWVENEIIECLSPQDALEIIREELEND